MEQKIVVPRYYQPWPHQQACWRRRRSGKWDYYFKLWGRQLGKDTDDIEYSMNEAWRHPGTQTAYIGLDNVWINNNIFNKYIEGRTFWDDYPADMIEVKDTKKELYMMNNPEGYAPSRMKFIGFLNDQGLIGSSYDAFYISEASLYQADAFRYIEPIWDRKKKLTGSLCVNFNGTPRGTHNVMYELLKKYTGCDDPEDFPGEHVLPTHTCYVDKVTIEDAVVPDGEGGWKKLYTQDEIEMLRARDVRAFGNDAFFRQENYCDFETVNAGLVYRGVELLVKENRYTPININTAKPVYIAFDISSKGKMSDATAAIIYQYYNGRMFVYDIYESRGVSLVEAVGEVAERGYWQHVRLGVLPWDSERSASSMSPIEEAQQMFPSVNWHALERERVDRGINLVREQLPNMVVNSDNCEWLMECFNNYEYKRLERQNDWTPMPKHDRYSHLMDALRYAVMGIRELEYFRMNDDGSDNVNWDLTYESGLYEKPKKVHIFDRKERKTDGGLYYYS